MARGEEGKERKKERRSTKRGEILIRALGDTEKGGGMREAEGGVVRLPFLDGARSCRGYLAQRSEEGS